MPAVELVLEEKHQPPMAMTSQSRVFPRVTLGASGAPLVVEAAFAEAMAFRENVPTLRTIRPVRVVVPSLEV